jgi:NSS family neurotransmitter:Na+ symporter
MQGKVRGTTDMSESASSQKRAGFSTGLGVIAATLGSAVGLGNIWKFPSLTGENGGATFLLIYLLSTLLVGLPIMIAEISLGRKARANAITTMRKEAPGRLPWWLVGVLGVLAAFLILAFYTEVAGWVFAYIFKSLFGHILSTDPQVSSAAFSSLVTNPLQSLVCQWVVLVMIAFIIILGVRKGIEQTTKRLMPILFFLLVVLVVRSLTLPGAKEGLAFLFKPDFSRLTGQTLLVAMGLSFFKLSIGMGTMITYGSYFREDQNIPKTAATVMLADLSVSLLAGMAIFPAVFTFGFTPEVGPSLLFVTIPAIFASLPFGNVFAVLFFVLAAVAATGAMLSILEVPVAFLNERLGLSRTLSTILTVILLGLVGSTAALSNSVLANFKLFGLTMFDLFDYVTSNLMLPIGGLFIAIFVGWVWNRKSLTNTLTNNDQVNRGRFVPVYRFVIRYVTPLLVLLILLNGLGILK